jgi:ankyrin repeat protein
MHTVSSSARVIAEQDAGRGDVAWRTAFGDSALHCAACEGQLEMARLLLAAGADINARNVNKQTPLGWAVQYKKPEVAALLVSFGGEK